MVPDPFVYIDYNLIYLLITSVVRFYFSYFTNIFHTINVISYFLRDGKPDKLPETLGTFNAHITPR